jgi:hypothetical protein
MRAGMIASRLYHRGHVIPAQTDHMEDDGRVGLANCRAVPRPLDVAPG